MKGRLTMKKLFKAASIVCALCASMIVANAQEKDVTIKVDNRYINFTDQAPVIEEDRVMVPLRDVFVAMGAKVEWNGEKREVIVNSKDNLNRLYFTIDNPEFTKLTFVTILDTEIEKLTSDVAPKIINDRTMLPLRVVSENFNADVTWDAESYTVTIASKQFKKALGAEAYDDAKYQEHIAKIPAISIKADKETVAAGDTVTLSVDISNVTGFENTVISGVAATINYDTEKFEYAGCKIIGKTENEEPYALSDNPSFKPGVAKAVFVFDPTIVHEMTDAKVMEISFKAKAAGDAEFSLADTFTAGNNDNFVSMFEGDKIRVLDTADLLFVNTEAVKVTVSDETAEVSEEAEAAEETADETAEEDAVTDETVEEETDAETPAEETADVVDEK